MFIKRKGKYLYHSNSEQPLYLKGFNMTQNYWMPDGIILKTCLDDQPFKLASKMGANAIRLTVRHSFLEDPLVPFQYSEPAFEWLDLQVWHAKDAGLLITIALVLPIGGDWLDKQEGKDFSLWTDPQKQSRFVRVWKKIATRYAECPEVLGYDLFNVPITNDGTGDAYEALLSHTIEAIRQVDQHHLIMVSKLYGIDGCIEEHETIEQYRLVNDENVLYDSHFYDPIAYSHQYAEWIGNYEDGGSYPDETLFEPVVTGEFIPRNKAYLEDRLKVLIAFKERFNYPVHVGEIGLVHCCFDGDKGGMTWVNDVCDILETVGIGYYYWDFQSEAMGLIRQAAHETIDTSLVNYELASVLFKSKF